MQRPERPRPVRPAPVETVDVPLSRQAPMIATRIQRDAAIVMLNAMGVPGRQIAREVGLTEGRVRQIVKGAQDREPSAQQ